MYRKTVAVSVVMSLYNEPIEWIRESIESIIVQTFVDYEFIIINDKPDRNENSILLNEYVLKDNRIVIIENDSNIGLTKSLNKGLRIAKGKYIARIDADDMAMPNRFEKQYSFLEDNKDHILCGSFATMIDEHGNLKGKLIYPSDDKSIRIGLVLKNQLNHPTLFYRNSDKLRYDEEIKYAQDYDFVIKASKIGKLANLDAHLLKYRVSRQQIGASKLKEQDNFANKIRLSYIRDLLKSEYNITLSDDNAVKQVIHKFRNEKSTTISNIYFSLAVYLKMVKIWSRIVDFIFMPFPFIKKLQFLLS
ncbi:glycosyltransferase [Saccharicrinis sp. GN24d3]|uniref:glycosyltransferase n=1 Tax=Saccharicrinis sp. GN24d3 TaxID=3458416 RepID=UPI00403758A6